MYKYFTALFFAFIPYSVMAQNDTAQQILQGSIEALSQSIRDYDLQQSYDSGYQHGQSEGYLDGYGSLTGLTPGPVEVPYGSTYLDSGDLLRGYGSSNELGK